MHAILLVNLGSPGELTVSSIRLFLRRFLSDKRVINLPRILWYPILYGIILPLRAKRLLKQYRQIWLKDRSPLIYYTQQQQIKLQKRFTDDKLIILSAFSYSKPDIQDVLSQLHQYYDITELTVLPLYPQFSSTTTSAVFDQLTLFYSNKKFLPTLNFITEFYSNIYYVTAVAKLIERYFIKHGRPECLIFSYHSLPVKLIEEGDNYYEQCLKSSELIAANLKLEKTNYQITFQSRFGGGKWISPATASTMAELAKSGIKNIAVVCPGFISDCLETLEEIQVLNRQIFMDNGGSSFYYIPCLNDDELCIDLLQKLVKEEYVRNSWRA